MSIVWVAPHLGKSLTKQNIFKKKQCKMQCECQQNNKLTPSISFETGKGLIKVNGSPLDLVEPEVYRIKVWEPVLLLG